MSPHCTVTTISVSIPACSHIEDVIGNGEGGHLVQFGKALADNTPPLPLTEEHSLPVLPPPLFLYLGPSSPTSCSCSAWPKHLQPPQQADNL